MHSHCHSSRGSRQRTTNSCTPVSRAAYHALPIPPPQAHFSDAITGGEFFPALEEKERVVVSPSNAVDMEAPGDSILKFIQLGTEGGGDIYAVKNIV